MAQRNKKGQFVYTTGRGRYKRKTIDGKNVQYSRYVWEQKYGKIPKGLIIHHIDKDKYNNNLDNLLLLNLTAHNRIHSHKAWNKGITVKNNKKWAETIDKAQANRFKTFLPKFKESFELQNSGKKLREIALIQGISRGQVSGRIKRYKKHINLLDI
jgi:hypothetical protein